MQSSNARGDRSNASMAAPSANGTPTRGSPSRNSTPQPEGLPANAVVSIDDATRALRQYLLTEAESGELAGSIIDGQAGTPRSSDTGADADNDDDNDGDNDGDGSDTNDTESLAKHRRQAPHSGQVSESEASLANPLRLPSGSITYDLYKWHQAHEGEHGLADSDEESMGDRGMAALYISPRPEGTALRGRQSRARSLSAVETTIVQSEPEWDLPLSHTQINAPGGFRRQYLHQRAEDEGRKANILTSNFVDFLALYGHFAGGDFPSDEDDDDGGEPGEEEAAETAALETGKMVKMQPTAPPAHSRPKRQQFLHSKHGSVTGSHQRQRHVPAQLDAGDAPGSVMRKKRRALPRLLPMRRVAEAAAAGEQTPLRPRTRRSQRSTALGRRCAETPGAAAAAGGKASTRKTFFLLIKSFIGSGVLFLPRAFYNGGLLFSTIVMLLTAGIALYSMLLLVECYEKVHCGYGEIGRRLYGKWMERVVLLSIVVSQVGFSCAGAIFIATNARDLFNAVTDCQHRLSLGFWVTVQLVFYVPVCMVRHIKGFSSYALLADLFIIAGLAYVYTMDVVKISSLGPGLVQNFNPESYSLFLGTAAYTFEGYALILPIVDAMEQPSKFPRVLSLVMAICAAITVSMGALSYTAFGSQTEAIVLLNMPSGTPATLTVQLLYSLAILFTTPLMMFPVIRILEQALFPRRSGKRNPRVKMQKNAFRTLLLLVVTAVSVFGVEKLDKLVAVIGGFACVPISFVYPPLFHLKAAAKTSAARVCDILLACAGVAIGVYVTYCAVDRWGSSEAPYDFCDVVP